MKEPTVRKIYVTVVAEFTADGRMLPRTIVWEDGRKYRIDRITDCCRAVSLKAGGAGIRYTCRICGGDHHLFYEENGRWFVEAKDTKSCCSFS